MEVDFNEDIRLQQTYGNKLVFSAMSNIWNRRHIDMTRDA